MFDFSIHMGDTVDFCLLPDWETHIVDTIHQDVFQGFNTRRFQTLWNYDSYFEGIGSDYGLFEPWFLPVDKSTSNPLYFSYLYYYCRQAPCGLIVSLPEQQLSPNYLHLYPVPACDKLIIKPSNGQIGGEIRMYSFYVQEVMRIQLEDRIEELTVNISDLVVGSYFLLLSREGVILERKKVVITP